MVILFHGETAAASCDRSSARFSFPSDSALLRTMMMPIRSARGGWGICCNLRSRVASGRLRTKAFASSAVFNTFRNSSAVSNIQ